MYPGTGKFFWKYWKQAILSDKQWLRNRQLFKNIYIKFTASTWIAGRAKLLGISLCDKYAAGKSCAACHRTLIPGVLK